MKKFILAFSLALAFLIIGILTIDDYGITSDAPGHWLRGQAYAHYYLTGRQVYGEPERLSPIFIKPGEYVSRYHFTAVENEAERFVEKGEFIKDQNSSRERSSFYQHESWNGAYWIGSDGIGHPPQMAIVAALFNRFFYQKLGVVGDIESYQLFYLLVSAIGVGIVTIFAYEITNSVLAAIIAGMVLATFPLYMTHAHLNMKDPLQATFFAGAIWAFWHWVKEAKPVWRGTFILFVTLALSVKWNIVFLPFILLPWLYLIRKSVEFRRWFKLRSLIVSACISSVLFLIYFILTWPASWTRPFEAIGDIVKMYWMIGRGPHLQPDGFILPFGINSYPLALLLTQTPEIVLFLLAFAVTSFLRGTLRFELQVIPLFLLWLVVPILRGSTPGFRSYSGLIQIMEVLPAMAILAGIGADYIVQSAKFKVQSHNSKFKIIQFLFLLSTFYFLLSPIIRLHPNENVYFNILAGGLKGAVQKNLVDWTLTHGNIYKQAVPWLNKHVEEKGRIAFLDGNMLALSPLWLRRDISISPYHFSRFEKKGEYIIAVLDPLDPPVFAQRYSRRFLQPIHVVSVDGMGLLTVYKNDAQNTKSDIHERKLTNFTVKPIQTSEGDILEIDLGKNQQVTRIVTAGAPKDCLERNYEFIAFIPEERRNQPVAAGEMYVLHERENREGGMVEYFFAAEMARFIRIYPQSEKSCFASGRIASVFSLQE